MKSFLFIHSLIYLVFAIVLFVMPSQIWPLYGLQINDQYAYFLSQHTSIFLGGIAAIGLLFRNHKELEVQYTLLKGLLITNLLGVSITLYAVYKGVFFGLGWSDPMFFGLMAILSFVNMKKINRGE